MAQFYYISAIFILSPWLKKILKCDFLKGSRMTQFYQFHSHYLHRLTDLADEGCTCRTRHALILHLCTCAWTCMNAGIVPTAHRIFLQKATLSIWGLCEFARRKIYLIFFLYVKCVDKTGWIVWWKDCAAFFFGQKKSLPHIFLIEISFRPVCSWSKKVSTPYILQSFVQSFPVGSVIQVGPGFSYTRHFCNYFIRITRLTVDPKLR